jgi:nucleoid-associated protein YgaU
VNNTEKLASKPRQVEEVQKTASKPEVTFVQRHSLASLDEKKGSFNSKSHQVYIIRPGDTLGKIAMRFYGDAREWKKIYAANRHLLDDNKSIEVGQKIVLP